MLSSLENGGLARLEQTISTRRRCVKADTYS